MVWHHESPDPNSIIFVARRFRHSTNLTQSMQLYPLVCQFYFFGADFKRREPQLRSSLLRGSHPPEAASDPQRNRPDAPIIGCCFIQEANCVND
jgi:hypothetical protein